MIKKLTLASAFNEIEKIEPFLDNLKNEVDEKLYNKIQLAANEAATNAVIHGNKEDSSKKVEVTAQIQEDEIEITVKDEGTGFDPGDLPDPTSKEQLLKEGGRGVFLIKQYADEVSFEKNGTLVKMKFYIK